MAISAETQAAADLLRSEQLSSMAAPPPTVPPVNYNVPYSLGIQSAPSSPGPQGASLSASGIGSIPDPGFTGSLYLPANLAPETRLPSAFLDEASGAANDYPETDPGLGYPTEWIPYGGPDVYRGGPYNLMTTLAAQERSQEIGPAGWGLTEPSSARSFQEGSRGRTVGDPGPGGLSGLADGLADRGRYGDSMLVHMAPEEVAGLASLTRNGITINPETGLPEMFNLAGLLPMIVGIGASFIPGIGPLAAAALSGLTTAATTEGDIGTRLGKGLLAGVGSYALGGLSSKLGAAGVPDAVSSGMGPTQAGLGGFQAAPASLGAGAGGIGGVDFTGALPGGAFPGEVPFAGMGGEVMSAAGVSTPYSELPASLKNVVSPRQYAKGMEEMVKRVPPPPPPLSGGDAYVPPQPQPQLPPGARQQAFESVFEKPIGEWQRTEAYRQAGPLDKLEYLYRGAEEGIDWDLSHLIEGETPPGKLSLGSVVRPAAVGLGALSQAGAPSYEYEAPDRRTYEDRGPYFPEDVGGDRERAELPPGYIPGVSPQLPYFAAGGDDGNLPYLGNRYYAQEGTEGMTVEESMDVEAAVEIPSGTASTAGIMQGAPMEVQDDVEVRLSERSAEEPQNPRERAIYDRAVLALQNELESEVAQRAIDEFLEVFGPDALHMLQEMVRGKRENGGTVETVNGETTVEEGDIQGPDVIAGKIVDPVTGEETANLRVGENEYIEPAASLARRAQVAGLSPTPENGAMIRGEEERMLRQAVG